MIKAIMTRALLAGALLTTLAGTAAAQVDDPTLEGVEWHLVGYAVGGEVTPVPWTIDATLLLEDGTAAGSTGCNRFSGSYALTGSNLTFDPAMTMTRRACPEEQSSVEDGYTANLPQTASWSIDDDVLTLRDAVGTPLLDLERSVIALTASDVAAITAAFADQQAQIDRLDERLTNMNISVLRERLRDLEAAVKQLRSAAAASSSSGSSTFDTAEQTLLQGIPARIRSTCKPLRVSSLPSGTVAAVQCNPNTSLVKEMAYYLMDYPAGRRTFNRVMSSNSVPERYRCPDGRASQMLLHPYSGEGCYVKGGVANVRLMYLAAGCTHLDAGSTHLDEPVIYVAIEGTGNRIKPLWAWTRDSGGGSGVTRTIPAPGQPLSPACEGGF